MLPGITTWFYFEQYVGKKTTKSSAETSVNIIRQNIAYNGNINCDMIRIMKPNLTSNYLKVVCILHNYVFSRHVSVTQSNAILHLINKLTVRGYQTKNHTRVAKK